MFNETHLEAAEHFIWKMRVALTVVSVGIALVELGYAAAASNAELSACCGNPDCEMCRP